MATHLTIESAILTPEQEQEKWLGEAQLQVQDKAAHLQGAIGQGQIIPVLKFASQMLGELRTSMLSPQNYYELFMKVFDELHGLQQFFFEIVSERKVEAEMLYATVQHAGNIVPRLYMLVTAGVVYIKTKAARCCDILADLVEMCKGVQHPTRGLFLRHYLLSMTKNLLPDTGNEYEGKGGDVNTSINFVLKNFREMVWLWVRMEYKASNISSKPRRDRERRELRSLVGYNLVRLSQLDGVDRHIYAETILPEVLRIVLDFKEPIAQQYLLEVVVQVFPDEFHLLTMNELLSALPAVCPGVNVHAILTALMDRLGNYVVSLRDGTTEGGSKKEEKAIRNMFTVFQTKIAELASSKAAASCFPPQAFAETLASLIKLSIKAYPGVWERVDEVLGALAGYFSQCTTIEDPTQKVLRKLLEHVVDQLADPNVILDLQNFVSSTATLGFIQRRLLALSFVAAAAKSGAKIGTVERVGKLFDVIAPIVREVSDTPADKRLIYTSDLVEEFAEEQHTVCRALHLIDCEDLSLLAKLYSGIRKQLAQGGSDRLKISLKAMSGLYLRLALRVKKVMSAGGDAGINPVKIFTYLHSGDGKGLLEHLASELPVDAFPLYVTAANAADTCELPDNAYDLFAAAFTIYEEHAADSRDQMAMLNVMISATSVLRTMPEETYMTLATKLCQYSTKMLLKPAQARMVMLCSHLFWKKTLSEDSHKKVVDCMQRSLKITDGCPGPQQFSLFVEALSHYLYYYSAAMPLVTPKAVNAVIEVATETMNSGERSESTPATTQYFKSLQSYIRQQRQASGDERWQLITGA